MQLTRWGISLAGIVLVSRLALAQAQNPLQDVTKQVDKVFEKWDKPDSPGCALGVYSLQGRTNRLQAWLRHGQPE
jgi:hypothetical protein